MTELVQILLNGFVRKTTNSDALKSQIRSTGAKLARKGRSSKWQLHASNEQIFHIVKIIEQSGENSWLWLAKKLNEKGISEDVKTRPREHVRDDAGHASMQTTDRYIESDLRERHASGKNKRSKNL